MNKNFPILLEKKDNIFYCSIPEFKLASKSENLNEAYEKIIFLKNEHLNASDDYLAISEYGNLKKESTEDLIKRIITITFFLLLFFGIGSHLVISAFDRISEKAGVIVAKFSESSEQLFMTKTLKNLGSLSPEEKKLKLKKFQTKLDNAQKILKEAKPFIDASKPFLKNLNESFDLKKTR